MCVLLYACSITRAAKMEVVVAAGSPSSLVVVAVLESLSLKDDELKLSFGVSTTLKTPEGVVISGTFAVARYLARVYRSFSLYGRTVLDAAQVDHWLEFSLSHLAGGDHDRSSGVSAVERALSTRTYLVGTVLTLADFAVFAQLMNSKYFSVGDSATPNINRWYDLINNHPGVRSAVAKIPKPDDIVKETQTRSDAALRSKREEGGKFVELPGASEGNVVVRFPPEAGGYLHIGHAKAALLNQYYQLAFKGQLIMRFDDTNPEKEKEEYEKVILEDVAMLGIKPDIFSFTSDHFDRILRHAEELICKGLAFVDDTPQEEMNKDREERKPSKNRDNSLEKNLSLWQEMVSGSAVGQQCCLRAKMDPTNDNGCLRDPTIYRCKMEPHPHTGTKFKVYPTYDFACPIVDSVEGVTHALRTTEYHDRDPQYYWFIEKLELRRPFVWEYSRLNLQNTVLSKRKLTWFVENGLVDGWGDPRMPTVRGVLRRGMTVEGLKEFIIAQGSSRAVVFMEWDKIWAYNKKVIDPVAPRYIALTRDGTVPFHFPGVEQHSDTAPKHPKNPSVGTKEVFYGPHILVEAEDAEGLKEGDKVTLINWGNAIVTTVSRDPSSSKVTGLEGRLALDDTNYKNTPKLTWLAEAVAPKGEHTPTTLLHLDVLIKKPVLKPGDNWKDYINYDSKKEIPVLGDPMLRQLKKGDVIQLLRRGYYICDAAYAPPSPHTCVESPCVLINIPDGHTKTMSGGESVEGVKQEGSRKVKADQGKGKSGAPKKQKAETAPEAEKPAKKQPPSEESGDVPAAAALHNDIIAQGSLVRELKSQGGDKSQIDVEVKRLLELKGQYKQLTGHDWTPLGGGGGGAKKEKGKGQNPPVVPKAQITPKAKEPETEQQGEKKATRLGMEARKEVDLSEWYSQVLTKAEMIEYYDISGCYVLRPWSFSIWEYIKEFVDTEIKKFGVTNCYFPIFVSKAALEKEKEHVADFAPEVAWVTKSGESDLSEPIAIRPTSETVMYPAYARWVQSHRDLPIKLNQWNNVVRWEFKHPQPFLRTREFLWQEGHTVHASKKDAEEETLLALSIYQRVYEELLAVAVVPGRKTLKEKFAGSDYTTTVEGFIAASGRGIQGATSHHLGQNFSKMFDISFKDPDTSEKCFAYQNSWGITTRTIGVMTLVHGDNKGLVLPPRVACVQVVVVPCGITAQLGEEERASILTHCQQFTSGLQQEGVRVHLDARDNYSPGWKFNHWELKGVPVRVEIGPRDINKAQFVAVCRDTGDKITFPSKGAAKDLKDLLDEIQGRLLAKAKLDLDSHIKLVLEWKDFIPALDQKNVVLSPFCLRPECEDAIKKDSQKEESSAAGGAQMGAKSLCIPFDLPKRAPPLEGVASCIHCSEKAEAYTLFGRSY